MDNMNSETSLVKLMQDNDDFIKRMELKKVAVKKDKEGLVSAAKIYENKYKDEIADGTKRRQLLIEDGRRKGKTEEEVVEGMALFIPSKQTPILNMLYFLLHEYEDVQNDIQILREDTDKGLDFNGLRKQLDDRYGHLTIKDIEEDIPDLLEFIYKNVTLDIFGKIKKLKALSRSPNEAEAFRAYTKCMELCKKYNLEFDRVPLDVEEGE